MTAHPSIRASWAHQRRTTPRTVQRLLIIVGLLVCVSPMARANDFWKHKPPAQWSVEEALKLVRRSPWAKLEVVVFSEREAEAAYSVSTGTRHCDPDAIDPNGNCMQKGRVEPPVDSSRQMDAAPLIKPWAGFLVRWESASPVTQAFARLEELGERESAAFQAPSPRFPSDRYVITVKLEQPGRKTFEPFTVTPAGKPVLVATLKTPHGLVTPLEVELTGTGATSSVHFFFPRTLNGAALLGPERDWAEFTLLGAGFAIHSKFILDPRLLGPLDSREKP